MLPIRHCKSGKLLSAQSIDEYGNKLFIPGSKVKGGQFTLGRGRETWIVEGYATALSVQSALRKLYRDAQIRVAFSAANVKEIARKGDIIIADHDKNGIGAKYAAASGCLWWMPPESGDANDLHLTQGLPALVKALRAFILTWPR